MSKSLRSIPNKIKRLAVAFQRIATGEKTGVKGLGYWAAVDYSNNPKKDDK